MPQTVEIPDHGIAEFPDDMTPDQIKGVIQQKFFNKDQSVPERPSAVAQEATTALPKPSQTVENAIQAAAETASGFIPKSPLEVASMATPLVSGIQDIIQTPKKLSDVLFGGKTVAQAFPESQTLAEAETTPPFSKERFKAGFDVLGQLGTAAVLGRQIAPRTPTLSETLGTAAPESPQVAAVNEGLSNIEKSLTPEQMGQTLGKNWRSFQPQTPEEVGAALGKNWTTIKPEGVPPNASQIESTTPPDGGVRARSEMGVLPQGNVEAADARLRSDQGGQVTAPRQGVEAGTPPEAAPVAEPAQPQTPAVTEAATGEPQPKVGVETPAAASETLPTGTGEAGAETGSGPVPAKKAPPSIGTTGREIFQGWRQRAEGPQPPREVTVANIPGLGEFDWRDGKIVKLEKARGSQGYVATYRDATPAEIDEIHHAIDMGAFQLENQRITGASGLRAVIGAGETTKVLHQATGKPLSEFLETPEGKTWKKRTEERQRKMEAQLAQTVALEPGIKSPNLSKSGTGTQPVSEPAPPVPEAQPATTEKPSLENLLSQVEAMPTSRWAGYDFTEAEKSAILAREAREAQSVPAATESDTAPPLTPNEPFPSLLQSAEDQRYGRTPKPPVPPESQAAPSEIPPIQEPPRTGINNAILREQYGDSAPVAQTGKGPGAWKNEGISRLDNFQKTGDARNDPYAVLTNLREGRVPMSQVASDVSLLRAEHQRLVEAARQAEGTPQYEARSQAALDMANAIKGVAHGPASDVFRSLQEYDQPRYDNITDFDQALRERLGRESTPQEKASFQRIVDDVKRTGNGAEKEIVEAQSRVQKYLGKRSKLSFDDAAKSVQDQITQLVKDCIV